MYSDLQVVDVSVTSAGRRCTGDTISENGDVTPEFLPLDYFLCSFPE